MAQSNQKRKEFVGPEKQRGSIAMMAAAGMMVDEVAPSGTKSFTSTFTRHALYGGMRPLYGSFAGKTASGAKSFTVTFTRHAQHGGARQPYGSFAGK